jgi:protein-S-isoprenylcysteine O-methyltransferase Ste14
MQRQAGVTEADHPHVVAIPPVIYAGAFAVGLILEGIRRTSIPAGRLQFILGGMLALAGLGLMAAGLQAFRAAGTHVEVYRPATALVTTGPYRRIRNPIYGGMTLAYLGAGLMVDSGWVLLLAVPTLVVMHYGVVLREEAYLAARFGPRYEEYRRRVRRWI